MSWPVIGKYSLRNEPRLLVLVMVQFYRSIAQWLAIKFTSNLWLLVGERVTSWGRRGWGERRRATFQSGLSWDWMET